MTSLMAQMALLTNQIQGLTAANANGNQEAVKMAQALSSSDSYDEQCHFINRSFNFRPNNNLPTYYHPGLRNHENFTYANNQNVLQPTLESSKPAMKKPSSSLEELLKTYIVDSKAHLDQHDARLNNIETHYTNLGGTMKALETQVGQLANAIKGQSSRSFPSDTEKNPNECKAITLRSGRELEGPSVQNAMVDEELIKSNDDGKDKSKEENLKTKKEAPVVRPGSITYSDNPPRITPPLPFPQRFQKKALDEQFENFLNTFKKIHINIPFMDALEQMPNYAKFMKEVMSKKRKLEDYETMKLTEECSAIIKRQLPEKLKDPGSFTIPCIIRELHIEKALCDLRASINLMPLSIFQKLDLGEITPTTISLQLADCSLTYPKGIIEDVLVKIDKFIFPVDFVVLDMEEDQEIPIILGRPFLATGKALIDVHDGNLTIRVNDEEVKFNISNAMKFREERPSCNWGDVVAPCLKDFFQTIIYKDPLERCLSTPLSKGDLGVEFGACEVDLIDSVYALEALPEEKANPKEEDVLKVPTLYKGSELKTTTSDGLVLKQLPDHLRYIFLGHNSTKPVIISASLSEEDERKLINVLKRYSSTFAWSISDIKGISPAICMHKILMEDSYKPFIEHQRRVNPAMKEVVRAEVLKLLNAGIIYAIYDSSWVSPVQVLPKKGGMTVVKNEKNKLIPTRTVTG
ncbi:uncharacterized protein LOC112091888 [Morus notabilis]|uniref:uncharacterized protein LOC112091888 n=1 Tax=Morus notabilis TaxID=981085 RepID=UPI000CED6B22|nr:uncharacterized protein LOC112091888 [Morus notabilis]